MERIKIEISEDLVKAAKLVGQVEGRSTEEQIEHWARLGRVCIENPDLTVGFVAEILETEDERKRGILSESHFGQQM